MQATFCEQNHTDRGVLLAYNPPQEHTHIYSGVDKAPADLAVLDPRRLGKLLNVDRRILKFVASSFGLAFVLLTEDCILDPCYDTWQ